MRRKILLSVMVVAAMTLTSCGKASNKSELTDESELTTTISEVVYVTPHGNRYHQAGCRTMRHSRQAVSIEQAQNMGKTPCRVCKPSVGQ